jgi:hypothetical protein
LEIGITGNDSEKTEEDTDSNELTAEIDGNKQPGRYVFVKVDFKEANLGERPVEPVAPEMPKELQQAEESKDEVAADTDTTDSDVEATEEPDGEQTEEDPLAAIRTDYDSAIKNHEIDMVTYEADVKAFEKKVADGIKKAEDLNRRFAEWYYVVPGETFDKLRLSREDIVKGKEEPKPEDGAANSPVDPGEARAEDPKPKESAPTVDGKAKIQPTQKAAEEKTDTVEETVKPAEEPSSAQPVTDIESTETEPTAETE